MAAGSFLDVVVVGAGPAGSTAGAEAARRGLGVLLLEKCVLPRLKPCGGGLTPKAYRLLDCDLGPVVQARTSQVRLHAPHHRPFLLTAPRAEVWMVDRAEFDYLLVGEACRAGARLHQGEALVGIEFGPTLAITTERAVYRTRALVGADGADSVVARLAGLRRSRDASYALALELEGELAGPPPGDAAIVDFGLRHGYFWAFPKGTRYNVGVGAFRFDRAAFRSLRGELGRFLADHRLAFRGTPRCYGHKIPLWSGQERLNAGPILLAGDAAGLADPLFGEGIAFAIRSGQIAATTLTSYLAGECESPDEYTRTIHATLGRDLDATARLAGFVYRWPSLALALLQRSQGLRTLAAEVVSGDRSLSQAWRRSILPPRAGLTDRLARSA